MVDQGSETCREGNPRKGKHLLVEEEGNITGGQHRKGIEFLVQSEVVQLLTTVTADIWLPSHGRHYMYCDPSRPVRPSQYYPKKTGTDSSKVS